jgi:hypothetical protein
MGRNPVDAGKLQIKRLRFPKGNNVFFGNTCRNQWPTMRRDFGRSTLLIGTNANNGHVLALSATFRYANIKQVVPHWLNLQFNRAKSSNGVGEILLSVNQCLKWLTIPGG